MTSPSLHALLLLSDSALPLGSFAFSSGLESFLSHKNLSNTHTSSSASTKLAAAETFLEQSVVNLASTALPYVLSAYQDPSTLEDLDNDFDASTPCTVARRASIAQGRALLQIWQRALLPAAAEGDARDSVSSFAIKLKANVVDDFGLQLQAHFAPLFGAVCAALCLSVHDTAYLFLLNHAKAVLSAAVRASVIGPYQSQALLSDRHVQDCINVCIEREKSSRVDGAAVTVPTMDLWMGRHELLYSRIFNS